MIQAPGNASSYPWPPPQSRIGDFIAGLKELAKEPISSARVTQFLAQERPSVKALAPYLLWSPDRYARNLIYRDAMFEVLALCWLPGQRTPIHSHNGQLGWVSVVQGELVCCDYRFVRSLQAEGPERAERQESTTRRVEVELLGVASCQADGSVAVVDRLRTTHQLENLERSRYGTVSLHVYSKPIDGCVVFDETRRCCERRQLQYYSANGEIVEANGRKHPGRESLARKHVRYA